MQNAIKKRYWSNAGIAGTGAECLLFNQAGNYGRFPIFHCDSSRILSAGNYRYSIQLLCAQPFNLKLKLQIYVVFGLQMRSRLEGQAKIFILDLRHRRSNPWHSLLGNRNIRKRCELNGEASPNHHGCRIAVGRAQGYMLKSLRGGIVVAQMPADRRDIYASQSIAFSKKDERLKQGRTL